MKKLITISLMLMAIAVTSCKPEEDKDLTPTFTLETTSVTAPMEGGRIAVGYSITNPSEYGQLRVTTTASWISNLDWATTDGEISFDVAPNTSAMRTDTVKVEYAFQTYPIVVTQDEYKVVFDNLNLYAHSYGDGNYSILLGDSDYINTGSFKQNSNYFFFDLYDDPANVPADKGCFDIPRGTFTFDADATGAPGTIGPGSYTSYIMTDDENVYQAEIGDCTMVVTDTGITVDLTLKYGGEYKIIYDKAPHYHASSSTIDTDVDVQFSDSAVAIAIYYADYYDYDYPGAITNYEIQILDPVTHALIDLDLISDQEFEFGQIPTGEFDIFTPERFEEFSGQAALSGALYGDQFYPSFLAVLTEDNQYIAEITIIHKGTVNITKSGTDNYTITVDALNDTHDGSAVKASWSGTFSEWIDGTADLYSAPARVASKSQILDFSKATIKAESKDYLYTPGWRR